MAKDLLVGSTGFVGGNLAAKHAFAAVCHSTDIAAQFGAKPDLCVYAGVPAAMFLANADPDADLAVMAAARENLRQIAPKQLVLISSIAVYADSRGKDEQSPMTPDGLPAYGRNRLQLERWVREDYPNALIVRLPALYGIGLKKNFLFDLHTITPAMLKPEKYTELAQKSPLVRDGYTLADNGFYKLNGAVDAAALREFFAGEYKFLGHIHYADGTLWGRRRGDQLPFDPGVLADDDGRVWLYSGFYNAVPAILTGGHKLRCDGGTVLELEKDMVTIKTEPRVIFPKKGPGAFQGHEFFEASSIRKEGKTYIFVYSSRHNHELCYATSQSPDRDFSYGGTLVSQGDIFLDSNLSEKHAANYLGNTHGGLLKLEDKWYVFYHRQTNRHSYSRQACAEKLRRNENGAFLQAEVTSCGLNDGPLKGKGRYEARIACNLWGKNGTGRYDGPFPKWRLRNHPYFTQDGPDREDSGNQYIANMRDGAVAGFKYFAFKDAAEIKVHCTGSANGRLQVSTAPDFSTLCADIFIKNGSQVGEKVSLTIPDGTYPLYFRFTGSGKMNFHWFELQ